MDIDKVPQNTDNLHKGSFKTIVYAVDHDGNYVATTTSGWKPEDIAHEQAWDDINKRIEETKSLVLKNKLSPIAYFMEKETMTPRRLAGYVGLSVRKVKRHLTSKGFEKITKTQLTNYANVFEINIDQITNFKID